jgi:hypothetical protein
MVKQVVTFVRRAMVHAHGLLLLHNLRCVAPYCFPSYSNNCVQPSLMFIHLLIHIYLYTCIGLENRDYGRRGSAPLITRLSAKVGTNFSDNSGRSVGVVRSRTQATEFVLFIERFHASRHSRVQAFSVLCINFYSKELHSAVIIVTHISRNKVYHRS